MARRLPITRHPAFAPFIAGWFAALLGLGTALLPEAMVARWLPGLSQALAAGLAGAVIGLAIARMLARRTGRPLALPAAPITTRAALAEAGPMTEAEAEAGPGIAAAGAGAEPQPLPEPPATARDPAGSLAGRRMDPASQIAAVRARMAAEFEGGPLILAPPPRPNADPAPDFDRLLARFDSAVEAFHAGTPDRPHRPGQPAPAEPPAGAGDHARSQPRHPAAIAAAPADPRANPRLALRQTLDRIATARRAGD